MQKAWGFLSVGAIAAALGVGCSDEGLGENPRGGGDSGSGSDGQGGVLNLNSSSSANSSNGAGGGAATCDPVVGCNDLAVGFEYEATRPTVMILVDRSSSMFDIPFGASPNRWDPLKEALVGANGVVAQLQDVVRFGFATYTHQQANGAGACPLVDAVSIADNNYEPIKALYDAVSYDPVTTGADPATYKGETPTGAAVNAILPAVEADQAPGPKFLMVVTDGEPDTCAQPDPQCGQDESIAAIQAAHAAGIKTFVVGVGEIGLGHLQDLANAGDGQPVIDRAAVDCGAHAGLATYSAQSGTATYFRPEDPDALRDAIAAIINGVRSCQFEMNYEIDTAAAGLGTVLLDCNGIPYGDANGWQLNGGTQLELVGDSCTALKSALTPQVFISFPCDVIVK